MDADELHIRVTDQAGAEHHLPALEGWSVMEIIRDAGLPLEAACGGVLKCVSCRVEIDPAWYDRLPPRTEAETRLLDDAPATSTSRLSCQILMAPELDGLPVRLAPGTDA